MKFIQKVRFTRFRQADILIAISIIPLFVVALYDPSSFILGWNEGRSGMLFGVFFLIMEWLESRNLFTLKLTLNRKIIFCFFIALLSLFFFAVYALNLHSILVQATSILNVQNDTFPKNWVWLWEYIVLGTYFFGILSVICGIRSLSSFPTPFVYLFGMASILFLDGVFPYESLGLLQGIVPIITETVVSLLWLSGVQIVRANELPTRIPSIRVNDNLLSIRGTSGYMNLLIYWPCVGILSMLIYSLIVIIMMTKLHAPFPRKIFYALIGSLGTFLINILRVFSIVYYVTFVSVDVKVFHENIGEIMFLIWIIVFLLIVVRSESWLTRRLNSSLKIIEPKPKINGNNTHYLPIQSNLEYIYWK